MAVPPLDLDSAGGQLGWLLGTITQKLQLSDTQRRRAEDHYLAVGSYLEQHAPRLRTHIAPQGSMALGTTVKPWGTEEYDLDLVLEIANFPSDSPLDMHRWLFSALLANGRYTHMVEPLKRCVRLNYAGDFHMDILPARPDPRRQSHGPYSDTCVEVPDTELQLWLPSNPRGYVLWFEEQCSSDVLLLKRALEPLPDHEPAHLRGVLRQIVQLVKRQRDVWFRGDDDAPRSVVLTTLIAQAYQGELSLYDALRAVVGRIEDSLPPEPLKVPNPTNPDEPFSEHWLNKPASYAAFRGWWTALRTRLDHLRHLAPVELDKELAALFGETLARQARDALTDHIRNLSSSGQLRSTGRALSAVPTVGTAVRRHTFYGDPGDE